MQYSLGDTLADYGFSFLESLHSPIFLVHKNGNIRRMNEAGRKLISVAHLTAQELNRIALEVVSLKRGSSQVESHWYPTQKKGLKMISKQMGTSDYVLVELIR